MYGLKGGGGVLHLFFYKSCVMTKNLETADTLVKLVLAISVILLYSVDVIAGPFAVALVVLAALVLLIYAMKVFLSFLSR